MLTTETFLVAIGRSPKGKGGQVASGPDGLPPFLSATALKPFIDQELGAPTVPVKYRTVDGGGIFLWLLRIWLRRWFCVRYNGIQHATRELLGIFLCA